MTDALTQVDGADAFVTGEPVPGVAYGVVIGGELVHARGIGTVHVRRRRHTRRRHRVPHRVDDQELHGRDRAAAPRRRAAASGRSRRDARPGAAGAPSARRGRAGRSRSVASCRCRPGSRATIRGAIAQQDLAHDGFSEFLEGGQSFAFMPGTAFEYSNLGYAILGRVITNVTGAGVPRRRPLAVAGTAGHDLDRIRGRGVPRRAPRDGLRPARRHVRRRAVRRIRRVRRDGRPVQHGARPRGLGRRVRPRVRTSRRGRASAVARVSPGDAAGPSHDGAGADVDLHRRAPDRRIDGIRVRNVRAVGHGARHGRRAQRRLPGVRLAHAMASRVGRGRRGAGQPDVLPRAQGRRPDAAGAGARGSGPDPSPDAGARRSRSRETRSSACSRHGTTTSRRRRSR